MAALQVLKFKYKQDRLDFTSHHTASYKEFEADKITRDFVEQLLAEGKFDELDDLLKTGSL